MNSLAASRWAQTNRSHTNSPRPGDWSCPACRFSNYSWRTECFNCSKKEASSLKSTLPAATSLATSQWSPRKSIIHGRHKCTDVWTFTEPVTRSEQNYGEASSSSQIHKPPDLGLPYEVQHFILKMIQQILEEGCYDFAVRVIPQVLNENGWKVSEMVELKSWKDTLPNKVPATALTPITGYPLQQALTDAVRIRNAAAHRHLCDNVELREMTKQAENLMTIFGDVRRRRKFEWLWDELVTWDREVDSDTKRAQLEEALKSISERPVDGMDWTPNSMSLEEVTRTEETQTVTPPQEEQHDDALWWEPMEID